MGHRRVLRTVTLEGEPVRLWVDRLTVDELDAALVLSFPRGSRRIDAPAEGATTRRMVDAIDRHIEVCDRDVEIDGQPAARVGAIIGAQSETVVHLFQVLIAAQELSADETHALTVGTRFLLWLAHERATKGASKWVETGANCRACHALGLCEKRACGDTPARKPVWHDQKVYVKQCPVLSLTPEVERAIRLFEWTHTYRSDGFQPVALPGGPAVPHQEAWTLSALAHVRGVYTDVYQSRVNHGRQRTRH